MLIAKISTVSIPSNGSIQFLRRLADRNAAMAIWSQSPQTGQFNSYTIANLQSTLDLTIKSQSPQTGQFNSYTIIKKGHANRTLYVSIPSNGSIQFLHSG